jgi:putative PIN family toxin of toxin-antitoxin system
VICRKAADYMPPIESLTRRGAPRAVIDTNAVLDWLVFGNACALRLGDSVRRGEWAWCASAPMLDELRAVLNRPLLERWEAARKLALTMDVVAWVAAEPLACAVPHRQHLLLCRDPADQKFIDLAVHCAPCWLVTRDRALLALRRRAGVRGVVIATPEQWHAQWLAQPRPHEIPATP